MHTIFCLPVYWKLDRVSVYFLWEYSASLKQWKLKWKPDHENIMKIITAEKPLKIYRKTCIGNRKGKVAWEVTRG